MRPMLKLGSPLLALCLLSGSAQIPPSAAFPGVYSAEMVLYAVSDRPDGFVRKMYASRDALNAARAGRDLPVGAWLAIEKHAAQRKGGVLERDAAGHLIAGALERDLDVRRKLKDVPLDFEDWEYARLEAGSGATQNVNTADCWVCHQSAEKRDFTFSLAALARFARTGTLERRDCARPERELCDDDYDFHGFGTPGRR